MRRRLKVLLLAALLFVTMLPVQTKKTDAAYWSTITPGKYYLRNVATGKFLNVCNGGNWNNCDVDNWYFNGCSAQVWYISGNSNSYMVRPGCSSSRVLNQWGNNVVSGHNVCLWDNTNDPSQRWVFQRLDCNGTYIVRCAGNTDCVLDVNEYGSVCVCNYANRNSQKWVLTKAEVAAPSGTYTIRSCSDLNKYLTVAGSGDYNNCPITLTSVNLQNNQKWIISGSVNYYRIKPKNTVSRVLNQWGDNVVSGHPVCLWDDTNHPSQRWVFEEVEWCGTTCYVIHSAGNLSCVLERNENDVRVAQYTGAVNQLWRLN